MHGDLLQGFFWSWPVAFSSVWSRSLRHSPSFDFARIIFLRIIIASQPQLGDRIGSSGSWLAYLVAQVPSS